MAARNGRYTLGAQAAQIEAIAASVARIEAALSAHITEDREWREATRRDLILFREQVDKDVVNVRERVIGLEHDARITNRAQASFTAIVGTVAGILAALYNPKP